MGGSNRKGEEMAKISELYSLPVEADEMDGFYAVTTNDGKIIAFCVSERAAQDICLAFNRHDELFERSY